MVDFINKSKKLRTKPIELSNKNKCMAHCSKLSFGILSYSSYTDFQKIKIMNRN